MSFSYNDSNYDIKVIRKNNKNAYIRVKDNVIEVVVPTYYTDKMVEKLVLENKSSITKMLNKASLKSEMNDGFWYLGVKYDIIKTPLYDIEFSNSKVYVNDLKNLDKFIKNKAKSLFLERLDYWYSVFLEKIPYPKLRIRVMKTRWGVCNRKNNTVTLNLDLIKYSVDKLDYVIIHELSHFVHFNHSESFWKLVSKYCPDYKKIRKELR